MIFLLWFGKYKNYPIYKQKYPKRNTNLFVSVCVFNFVLFLMLFYDPLLRYSSPRNFIPMYSSSKFVYISWILTSSYFLRLGKFVYF